MFKIPKAYGLLCSTQTPYSYLFLSHIPIEQTDVSHLVFLVLPFPESLRETGNYRQHLAMANGGTKLGNSSADCSVCRHVGDRFFSPKCNFHLLTRAKDDDCSCFGRTLERPWLEGSFSLPVSAPPLNTCHLPLSSHK